MIYVPVENGLKKIILQEMHNVPYVGYPDDQKALVVENKEFY